MAANSLQDLVIYQENHTVGHDIHCSIPVRRLVLNPPVWPVLETFCFQNPTSWHLALAYQQEADTGKVCYGVCLRRADFSQGSLIVSVSVSFLDVSGASVRFPRLICQGRMGPGHLIEGSLEEIRYPGYISHLFNLQLILKVCISIRHCHTLLGFCDNAKLFVNENKKVRSRM